MSKISIKLPASSANLGPGFDCLALSLNMYNEFTVIPSTDFTVNYQGPWSNKLEYNSNNLVLSSYIKTCQMANWPLVKFELQGNINIPPQSGLGSSATAIVAGICIAHLLNKQPINKKLLLEQAYQFENHADNIAATIYGGLTCAFKDHDKQFYILKHPIGSDLSCLIIYPHVAVDTNNARQKLPLQVELANASANLARVSLLVAAFHQQRYDLLHAGMQDFLHQKYRFNPLFKIDLLAKKLKQLGSFGLSLSGSGPAIIILGPAKQQPDLSELITEHFQTINQEISIFYLQVANQGLLYNTDSDL